MNNSVEKHFSGIDSIIEFAEMMGEVEVEKDKKEFQRIILEQIKRMRPEIEIDKINTDLIISLQREIIRLSLLNNDENKIEGIREAIEEMLKKLGTETDLEEDELEDLSLIKPEELPQEMDELIDLLESRKLIYVEYEKGKFASFEILYSSIENKTATGYGAVENGKLWGQVEKKQEIVLVSKKIDKKSILVKKIEKPISIFTLIDNQNRNASVEKEVNVIRSVARENDLLAANSIPPLNEGESTILENFSEDKCFKALNAKYRMMYEQNFSLLIHFFKKNIKFDHSDSLKIQSLIELLAYEYSSLVANKLTTSHKKRAKIFLESAKELCLPKRNEL